MLPKPRFLKSLEEIFIHSWWVILFSLLCYTWLEHENRQQRVAFHELTQQLMELKNHQIEASKQRIYLLNQINSQSDPAWVELTLIKILGLVPENQKKIYFSHENE